MYSSLFLFIGFHTLCINRLGEVQHKSCVKMFPLLENWYLTVTKKILIFLSKSVYFCFVTFYVKNKSVSLYPVHHHQCLLELLTVFVGIYVGFWMSWWDFSFVSHAAAEIEQVSGLFQEKQAELQAAVLRVEQLSLQLEDLRRGKLNGVQTGLSGQVTGVAALELRKLYQELQVMLTLFLFFLLYLLYSWL